MNTLRDAVALGAPAGHLGRDVAHRDQLEPIGKLGQIRQVHHLRDQPASDHSDPDPPSGHLRIVVQ